MTIDAHSPRNLNISLVANIVGSFIISISMGMTAVLFPVMLNDRGFSSFLIGMLMSLETIASLLICFALPPILRYCGMGVSLVATTFIRIPPLIFMAFHDDLTLWGSSIFFHALGCYTFLLLTQTWINALPLRKNFGLWMAIYSTSLSVGMALGPMLAGVMDANEAITIATFKPIWLPITQFFGQQEISLEQLKFLVALLTSAVAMLPIIFGIREIPKFNFLGKANILATITASKGPMFAIALAGVSYFGVAAFITVYGIRNGLTIIDAALLLSAFNFGAIALEIPLGWLSDKLDRRYMIVALTFLCAFCTAYLPMAIYVNYQAWALLFVWGGMVGAMYSISLALIGERFSGEELIAANAGYTVMEGLGGTLGILLIGLSMDYLSADGMPYVIMFACVLYFSFALTRYRVI